MAFHPFPSFGTMGFAVGVPSGLHSSEKYSNSPSPIPHPHLATKSSPCILCSGAFLLIVGFCLPWRCLGSDAHPSSLLPMRLPVTNDGLMWHEAEDRREAAQPPGLRAGQPLWYQRDQEVSEVSEVSESVGSSRG